ncbi:MAG: type II toxin-antitoxin system RelE/ParE family toxin [Deinococcota bacterium]
MSQKELVVYQTRNAQEPFNDWLTSIKDRRTRARILSRLDRLEQGHYGDHKAVGQGVFELRYFFGSGYRVYFAEDGQAVVLLLCGGDKRSQQRDITTAQQYWQDYQDRK